MPEELSEAARQRLYDHIEPEELIEQSVTVVYADSRAPVAGAEVLHVPATPDVAVLDTEERWLERHLAFREEEYARRYGWRAVTDAAGRATIRRAVGYPVIARKGALVGRWAGPAGAGPLVIPISDEEVFRLRIVDAEGRPARGAGVALDRIQHVAFFADNEQGLLALGRSELEGRSLQRLFPVIVGYRGDGIALEEPPRGPQVVRFPPTGHLVLEIRDRRGRPVSAQAGMSVLLRDASVDDKPEDRHAWEGIGLADGRVLFPFVQLGSVFEVFAGVYRSESMEETPYGQRVPGPTTPGQVRQAMVYEPEDLTIVAGRALDAEGSELGVRTLVIQADFAREPHRWWMRSRTGPKGGFRLPIPDWFFEQGWNGLKLEARGPGFRHLGLFATVRELPARGELMELHDLRFARAPLLVSGQVAGPDESVMDTRIQLVRRVGTEIRRVIDTEYLLWLPSGRFRYFGDPGEGQWAVCVPERGRRGKYVLEVPFEPGSEGLVVRLP